MGGCDSSSKQQLLTAVAKYLHSIGGNASPADCWDKDGDLKRSLANIQPGNQNSAEFNFCNLPTLPQESDGQLENKKVEGGKPWLIFRVQLDSLIQPNCTEVSKKFSLAFIRILKVTSDKLSPDQRIPPMAGSSAI